jgi:hypothetical protein
LDAKNGHSRKLPRVIGRRQQQGTACEPCLRRVEEELSRQRDVPICKVTLTPGNEPLGSLTLLGTEKDRGFLSNFLAELIGSRGP